MFRLSFALLAAALLNVSHAQNETKIESTVQLLFPDYCVSYYPHYIALLTSFSAPL